MKYTGTFSLEISMEEFLKFAIPKSKDIKEVEKIVENELYHCWMGTVDGSFGGDALDWKLQLYKELYREEHIFQTELSKELFGDFSLLPK